MILSDRFAAFASRVEAENPDPSISAWSTFEEALSLEPTLADIEGLVAVAGESNAQALQEGVGFLLVHLAKEVDFESWPRLLLGFLMALRVRGNDSSIQLGFAALDLVLGRRSDLLQKAELLELLRITSSLDDRPASYPVDSTAVGVLSRCGRGALRKAALELESKTSLIAWLDRLSRDREAELVSERAGELLTALR